jgi:hypothetical protein
MGSPYSSIFDHLGWFPYMCGYMYWSLYSHVYLGVGRGAGECVHAHTYKGTCGCHKLFYLFLLVESMYLPYLDYICLNVLYFVFSWYWLYSPGIVDPYVHAWDEAYMCTCLGCVTYIGAHGYVLYMSTCSWICM